jgi:hypothetical protein
MALLLEPWYSAMGDLRLFGRAGCRKGVLRRSFGEGMIIMKRIRLIRMTLGVLWLLMGTPFVWADNCGGPDDCKTPPPNISKAVVVVSIFAGAGLAFRSMNGSGGDPEPEEVSAQGNDSGASAGGGTDATLPTAGQPPASRNPEIIDEPLGDPGDLPGGN